MEELPECVMMVMAMPGTINDDGDDDRDNTAPAGPLPLPTPLPHTQLAVRYTHPKGSRHKVLAFTGKSGLTPLPRISDETDLRLHVALTSYQEGRFQNFTTRELDDMEALAPTYQRWKEEQRAEGGTEVAWGIHPVLQKDRWVHDNQERMGCARFHLPGFNDGLWEAKNPKVWGIVEPILKLASQVLWNCHTSTWFAALLLGEKTELPTGPGTGIDDKFKGMCLVFHPYKLDFDTSKTEWTEKIQNALCTRLANMRLDFTSSFVNYYNGNKGSKEDHATMAYMQPIIDGQGQLINLSLETFLPLLRNDLTPAERKAENAFIATTVLHEICHAIWDNIKKKDGYKNGCPEPYFEPDCLTELGMSMMHHVFGGRPSGITRHYPDGGFTCISNICSGGLFSSGWNNANYEDYHTHEYVKGIKGSPTRMDKKPGKSWNYVDYWPIPVGWYEDLHNNDFWEVHARKFPNALQMQPKVFGTRISRTGDRSWIERSPDKDEIAAVSRKMTEPFDRQLARRLRIRAMVRQTRDYNQKTRDRRQRMANANVPNPTTQRRLNDPGWVEPLEFPRMRTTRHQDILRFLVLHRGQDDLCMDTLPQRYPEHLLYNHIRAFCASLKSRVPAETALDPELSSEEFRTFLCECKVVYAGTGLPDLDELLDYEPYSKRTPTMGGEVLWKKQDAVIMATGPTGRFRFLQPMNDRPSAKARTITAAAGPMREEERNRLDTIAGGVDDAIYWRVFHCYDMDWSEFMKEIRVLEEKYEVRKSIERRRKALEKRRRDVERRTREVERRRQGLSPKPVESQSESEDDNDEMPTFFPEATWRTWISYCELDVKYFCWGPNGTVRRLVHTFQKRGPNGESLEREEIDARPWRATV